MNEQKEINLEEILKLYCNVPEQDKEAIIKAMKYACEKTIELATENAECVEGAIVNMGFENVAASVNKQSIFDTINQIK